MCVKIIVALNRLLVNSSASAAQVFGPKIAGSNPFGYHVLVGCFLIIFHLHLIISQQQQHCSPQTADQNCTFVNVL
jgi:hypothetical protein